MYRTLGRLITTGNAILTDMAARDNSKNGVDARRVLQDLDAAVDSPSPLDVTLGGSHRVQGQTS